MKTIALIGPTASGKSDLAVAAAKRTGAHILSLDSLSIYKEIDIASAKPPFEERGGVPHYGIDVLFPDEAFDVTIFTDLYRRAKAACEAAGVPLIIVGGTSFYLKALLDGISATPTIDVQTHRKLDAILADQEAAYAMLRSADPETAARIDPNDRYRTEKMLGLYLQTSVAPSEWFREHPPHPVLTECPIFEIDVERSVLRERIALRTAKMLTSGLIDEVAGLEQRYGRAPHPMKAIGIIEVLAYFDGKSNLAETEEAIITHTAQLAKRQQTFNRSQFAHKTVQPLEALPDILLDALD